MKNSEEDILKRFLQDTFSDYEPEPSDLTWENIRKEIQPQQPNVGMRLRQWIVPVVALLLLISGVVLNSGNTENKAELAMNLVKENGSTVDYMQGNRSRPSKGRLPYISETFVNTTTSKVESRVLPKIEKSLEVPTFSTLLNEPIAKQNFQEYSVSTKKFVGMDDKLPVVSSLGNSLDKNVGQPSMNLDLPDSRMSGLNSVIVRIAIDNGLRKIVSEDTDNNKGDDTENNREKFKKSTSVIVSEDTDNNRGESQKIILGNTDHNMEEKSKKSIHLTNPNSDNFGVVSVPTNYSTNDAVIQEIRYTKPLETLKNKDFVLVKNQIMLPKINEININREAKPIRCPLYVTFNVMPLQTYRILTINSQNIQNLQTNNLFDSERNGFAFDLGITKAIGNKWNFRGNISYLKMRQWAEYQVNTEKISVKNSNNYSNSVSVGKNDNEFIGQTRIEAKTLQMIGLKADVQRFFKVTGRNRYFISGGSQLMYESTQKQSNIFINASAGFQHLVNKDCFLTIEPTASYLLNNINDSKSLIQTNAYNLGLKVGVSFRVK